MGKSNRTRTTRMIEARARAVEEATRSRRKRRLARHFVVSATAAGLVGTFWLSRPDWVPEMRLWKAVGDASYILLVAALLIGPLASVFPRLRKLTKWRRQLGIWFAVTATVHGLLVIHGWARWSLRGFLGYELVPALGREARLEPGFGLANLIGVSALLLALLLAATSADWAIRRLGRPAWNWLHRLSQTILVLALLHGGYFLYIHFTESFHKRVPDPDWFRLPFIALGATVLALEALAFARSARTKAAAS